jgi:hypothetical protein
VAHFLFGKNKATGGAGRRAAIDLRISVRVRIWWETQLEVIARKAEVVLRGS